MASTEAPIRGFFLTFPYIWSCPAVATSIRLYRTVVHLQNGAAVTLDARRAYRGGRDGVHSEWPDRGAWLLAESQAAAAPGPEGPAPGNAGEAVDVYAERTGTPPHSPVKLSGIIPPLAD